MVFTLLCNHHHYPSAELLSSCRVETLYPLNTNTPLSSLPTAFGNYHSTFCLYELDHFKYLVTCSFSLNLDGGCVESAQHRKAC